MNPLKTTLISGLVLFSSFVLASCSTLGGRRATVEPEVAKVNWVKQWEPIRGLAGAAVLRARATSESPLSARGSVFLSEDQRFRLEANDPVGQTLFILMGLPQGMAQVEPGQSRMIIGSWQDWLTRQRELAFFHPEDLMLVFGFPPSGDIDHEQANWTWKNQRSSRDRIQAVRDHCVDSLEAPSLHLAEYAWDDRAVEYVFDSMHSHPVSLQWEQWLVCFKERRVISENGEGGSFTLSHRVEVFDLTEQLRIRQPRFLVYWRSVDINPEFNSDLFNWQATAQSLQLQVFRLAN